jgi:hypothetical protein
MGEIEAHESKLYSEFAPLYDKIFGKIFYSRLESVIEELDIPPGASSGARRHGQSFPAYLRTARSRNRSYSECWRAQRKIREMADASNRDRDERPGP